MHAWKRKKLLLSDFARAAALFYLTLIYGDIMAPASDFAIMCTVFYIIIKWLSQLEDEQKADNVTPYALLCVAGVYAVSLKLTAGLILILVLKPAIMLIRQKRWKEIILYLCMGIGVITPWLIRTVWISGYLLYPFPALDIFAVDWKIPAQAAALDAAEIKTWGRGLNNAALVNMPMTEWFPQWFQTMLPKLGKLFIIADIISIILGFPMLIIALFRRKADKIKDIGLVWLAIAASYLFWQLSAPLLRYGYAYILLLIALTGGMMWFGNTTILLMAGMMGIDTSLFEAAEVDGATSTQVFYKITLPLLRPILVYVVITSLIGGLQLFDVPQILTNGTGDPMRSTMTLIMFLNKHLYSKNYGMAGAVSVILFIITAILSLIVFKVTGNDKRKA